MATLDDSYSLNKQYFSNKSYLEWLESYTIDDNLLIANKSYRNLLKTLWDIPYYGLIGNDADRGEEGLELRIRYNDILSKKEDTSGFTIPDLRDIFGECRVLEMLIALSMHMYTLMEDMGIYNSVSRWFWEIMRNTGLDAFNDDVYDAGSKRIITRTVNDILELHSDAPENRGGWFKLYDWQSVELWYQMHEYLKGYFG